MKTNPYPDAPRVVTPRPSRRTGLIILVLALAAGGAVYFVLHQGTPPIGRRPARWPLPLRR